MPFPRNKTPLDRKESHPKARQNSHRGKRQGLRSHTRIQAKPVRQKANSTTQHRNLQSIFPFV